MIFKITKDTQRFTVAKAKTVDGKFGVQLWAAVQDAMSGVDGTLYLPWATQDGEMGGGARQLISAGLIGPEDFTAQPDVYLDGLQGVVIETERVFKDGKQFVNVRAARGAGEALRAAATKELDLQEIQDTKAFQAKVAGPTPAPARAPRESANDRIKRAFDHVMEVYAPQLAEMDPELVRALVALTATHAIGYEKEG